MKPKIVIVEDEREIAQLIQNKFETEGFTCEWCRDGDDALRVVQSVQPDLNL